MSKNNTIYTLHSEAYMPDEDAWVQSPVQDTKLFILCKFHTAVSCHSQANTCENTLLHFDFKQKV